MKPRPTTPSDWGAVEQAAERWDDLRITEADLPRVAAFLETQRARRLHHELVDFQETVRREAPSLEWAHFDPMVLIALLLVAEHVRAAQDHGFPPAFDHRPVDRWVVLLHWMLLVAEDAKLPVLSLAQQAMTAVLTRDGASRELARRMDERLGFDAAVVPLLDRLGQPDLAAKYLQRVRRAVKVPREARDDIDSAVMEEITRRLGQGPDLARAVEAVLAALPAGPRASRWDYLARHATQRLRRDEQRRQHRAPGGPGPEEMGDPADALSTPDREAALREVLRQPGMLAALRAEAASDPKTRRSGASKRRRDKLRRAIEDLTRP